MDEKTVGQLLLRGVREVIDADHLKKRLLAGDVLRVKLGIDPSTPDMHIGHAVPLRKLRQFQDAGHTAVLIIGDYTAQIGDPTGKNESRTMLTPEQAATNAKGYLDQAYTILDNKKTEVRWQSEWFGDFTLRDVIELMATTTVSTILSHETFAQRLKAAQPLHMHELLYPLLQGFDSVAVKADVELGGIDQKFNVLMGRQVQRVHGQPEQDVMLFPYLPGTDGQEKMSKSLNNTINLTDTPNDMFGKTMSIPDSCLVTYFELATRKSPEEIEIVKQKLAEPTTNPRDIKVELAHTIVAERYDEAAAQQAQAAFEKQFRQKEVPNDVETVTLPPHEHDLADIVVNRTTLVPSKSEFRRLVQQNGVKLNGAIVKDAFAAISPKDGTALVVQIGSRRFVRIVWKQA